MGTAMKIGNTSIHQVAVSYGWMAEIPSSIAPEVSSVRGYAALFTPVILADAGGPDTTAVAALENRDHLPRVRRPGRLLFAGGQESLRFKRQPGLAVQRRD